MSRTHASRTLIAAAVLGLGATSASAVDWGGYFRAGPGAANKDASRGCYGLPGPGLKYRLGNECDIYGEFALSQAMKADDVDYKATLMTYLHNPQTDTGDARVGINQMYVEGKGYDVAPGATFWIGKRFFRRGDVHIVDTFFTKMDGVGAGVLGIDAGAAKLGFAWFKTDADAVASGNRFNAEVYDIASNPGGKLSFVATATQSNFTGGKSGYGLSAQHKQDNFLGLGGDNTVWLQFAQGSAGLDSNFGSLTADSNTKGLRIVDGITWQVGALGGQAIALWQQNKAPDSTGAVVKSTNVSLGGRLSYALTKNFKLLAEYGHSEIKPEGAPTAKLDKFTFAPTLSTGPGFWNRPELRLYATHARWRNVAGDVVTGSPAFVGKETGTSYGAQVEVWF